MTPPNPYIGCAGWTVPKPYGASFPAAGSHLERYAQRFNAVEINSSFYRPHRRTTYERWAASVPDVFAFAVKAPREITHERRLADANGVLDAFLEQATGLGVKLGPLLFQLPPSLAFDGKIAAAFFAVLRARHSGSVVCEPRHPTWFTNDAEILLTNFRIARVAADPAIIPAAAEPGGYSEIQYFRLHGAPRIYYSGYSADRIEIYAHRVAEAALGGRSVWCIFDNTALAAATGDALTLQGLVLEKSLARAADP